MQLNGFRCPPFKGTQFTGRLHNAHLDPPRPLCTWLGGLQEEALAKYQPSI